MAILMISALPPGDGERRGRLVSLARELADGGSVQLLLYGDGVFNLVAGSRAAGELTAGPLELYAVAEDVAARGLEGRLVPEARPVDYDRVVQLVLEAERTVTGV